MGRKLYVGNLPYSATEQTLENAAIAELNRADLEGRPMKVDEAMPQAKRSGDRRGGSGGNGRW